MTKPMDQAKWITFDKALQSVNVYQQFEYTGGELSIDICGLGYFELYINGRRVSDDKFVPAWSNYCNRDTSTLLYPSQDVMTERTYYMRYDLSSYAASGRNTLCVVLGNGWFRQMERNVEGKNHYADHLLLRFEILENGQSICVSDASCMYTDNHIIRNNLYFGETQDFALFDSAQYTMPIRQAGNAIETGFQTNLQLQDCPADREIRTVDFERVKSTEHGTLYRAAENMSGYIYLLSGGGDVKVTYAEGLKDNGELQFSYTGGEEQIQQDVFLHTQEGDVLVPHFVWHGFQYFIVEGHAAVECVTFVHSDIEQVVDFRTDNETLNWLFDAYARTQLGNMHGGVPSDCPHRERLGYTGDGQITAETSMLLFDADQFYRKWIVDICDCQDIVSGHVQHTAPFYGGGGGPGGWGAAIVIVPYEHYRKYRDLSVLAEALPYIKKWINSMESFCDSDGLVVKEYDKGWCLGEWCTPDKVEIPDPFVNTYYYIRALRMISEICTLLDESDAEYRHLQERSLRALEQMYYDHTTGRFCNSVQGADAFGYDLGLGDERTVDHIIERYSQLKSFDTGIFGTEIICRVLSQLGAYQLLFDLLKSEQYPSFGFMRASGASTLWEVWKGYASRNHPMFGSCVKQLIYDFAGIRENGDRLTVSPKLVNGLNELSCRYKSHNGELHFAYRRLDGGITYEVSIRGTVQVHLQIDGEERMLSEGNYIF